MRDRITVKFCPAAVTICSSPSNLYSNRDSWAVSVLADNISWKHNWASNWCVGAVTIERSLAPFINRPLRHLEWKWTVTGVVVLMESLSGNDVLAAAVDDDVEVADAADDDDCLTLLRLFKFESNLLPGGCIGWQLRLHQPTGKISRES